MAKVSLTDKSVVFVDDNPLERESVKMAFPRIRTMGQNPYLTKSILLRAPETQIVKLTHEGNRREDMIRQQIHRESDRTVLSREDFLASLQAKVEFTFITDFGSEKMPRCLELINKTNQFNTTGQRWKSEEIKDFITHGGELVCLSFTDKYTDYGIIGVILIKGSEIVQYVMSCRVLGLGVEQSALSATAQRIRATDPHADITATMIETADNLACRGVYRDNGFAADSENNRFVLSRDADIPFPGHIARVVLEHC
jgi:FkbH-like protein